MGGLETAIRNALERSDRSNAEVRARIYQSARQALEASLRKQGVADPDAIAVQRHRLEETIHTIEREERDRLRPRAAEPQVPEPHRAEPHRPEPQMPDMEIRGETRDPVAAGPAIAAPRAAPRVAPVSARAAGPADVSAPAGVPDGFVAVDPGSARHHRPRRRGFYARLFVYSVFFAALGMGGWWVYTSGLLLSPAQRDTSVANPPVQRADDDFNGQDAGTGALTTLGPQAGFSDDWVSLFDPANMSSVSPGANATIEPISGGDGQAARIVSSSTSDGGAVSIAIGPDVLARLAGKRSTFALSVQGVSDKPTQISVECDFASMGDCGRHRFTVTTEKSDALFQVSFDRSMSPSSAGRLIINSDIEGGGRPLNLYAVRVLPGQ